MMWIRRQTMTLAIRSTALPLSIIAAACLFWSGPVWGKPPSSVAIQPAGAPPGATVWLKGSGFGPFTSAQDNTVSFNGVPALVQRWEADRIEVRVPSRATTGPVVISAGKKRRPAGLFTVLQPHIDSVAPEQAERGTRVQIKGRHFGPTAGSRDPNTMFGVNDVLIGGVSARPLQWSDDQIEVEVPTNARSGEVLVRLASSDPLSNGFCCEPVRHAVSNAVPLTLIQAVRVDPPSGPVGTKAVLFGQDFGSRKGAEDKVLIGDRLAPIDQWKDDLIVFHVPLGAESGPLVVQTQGTRRALGTFTVQVPRATGITPASAPIGTLLRITGEHFGIYSESGATPYSFMDFNTGENRVEVGGVPAVVYRWTDDRIEVWVPFSAKSGKVVVYRSAAKPNHDGTCCAERGVVATDAGEFTLVSPVIESYEPKSAGLDELVTIRGRGFGSFLKTAEHAQIGLNQKAYKRRDDLEINESGTAGTVLSNVSRTEVLFNGAAAQVVSWNDAEIVVRVPRRNLYGIGKRGEFFDNLATGPLVLRRGSWDVLPDGSCCTSKQWLTVEAGPFTIESTGLPDTSYWTNNRPDAATSQ